MIMADQHQYHDHEEDVHMFDIIKINAQLYLVLLQIRLLKTLLLCDVGSC